MCFENIHAFTRHPGLICILRTLVFISPKGTIGVSQFLSLPKALQLRMSCGISKHIGSSLPSGAQSTFGVVFSLSHTKPTATN